MTKEIKNPSAASPISHGTVNKQKLTSQQALCERSVGSLDSSILCITEVAPGTCGQIKLSSTVSCLQCMYNKCTLQCVITAEGKSQPKKTLELRGHLGGQGNSCYTCML